MHPSASGYARDLSDLRVLANDLFDALHDEYGPISIEFARFDRIDRLLDVPFDDDHLVAATLFCAQLLRRVTDDPRQAQPRHVVTLGDIIDQTLTSLLHDRRPDSRARRRLRQIHHDIGARCMNLALAGDPGAPDFRESL